LQPETDIVLENGDPDLGWEKVAKLVYKIKYCELASAGAELERRKEDTSYGEVAQLVRAPDS
jgi:hypothetical protein